MFDAAVNQLLIAERLLDPAASEVIGLVVESRCRFLASLAFPDSVEVGVAVEAIGRSSVNYRLAVFKAGADTAAADGRYTHVYVERLTGRPVAIPEPHRRAMQQWKTPKAP
jgi:acyl-CoA thioester hydrolase